MVCIGYVGIDAFDVILYIGRTIAKLKYKVLIVDLSGTGSITKVIKHPMDLDSTVNIINYRDINYTRKIPTLEELSDFSEGIIIIIFGWNYTLDIPFELATLNIVVNPLPNIIDKLVEIIQKTAKAQCNKKILVRNIISLEVMDRVSSYSMLKSEINIIDYLYIDITEYERAIKCQLTQEIRFPDISKRMKLYIQNQITDILPQLRPSKIKKALLIASKGV